MKISRFYDSFRQGSLVTRLLVGCIVLIVVVAGFLAMGLLSEVRSQAQSAPPVPTQSVPVFITKNPISTTLGSPQPTPPPTATEPPPTPTATVQPPSPPLALFTGSVTAQVGQTIQFNAGNSKANNGYQIADYFWDFGDGQTGEGAQANHSYRAAGTYQVVLTVTDDHGLTSNATQTVEVLAALISRPLASISGGSQAHVGQTIRFSGNGSQVNRGDQIVSFVWNFGDGRRGYGANVSHIYNAAGTYRVTLTVTDKQDLSSTASLQVQIVGAANIPPVAVINGFTGAHVGQGVTFDAAGSYANGGDRITGFTWDFGDGGTASGNSVGHSYDGSGSYVVTLTVTDNRGLTGKASLPIEINNNNNNVHEHNNHEQARPSVEMSVPDKAQVGQVVNMNGNGSHGRNDGHRGLVDFAWNFGDGTVADGETVSHTYNTSGHYQVTLTVTDEGGLSNTAHSHINIVAVPATPKPTATPKSTPRPKPTATPKPTVTPKPTATTPKPTITPEGHR